MNVNENIPIQELWQGSYQWLKLQGQKINKSYLKEALNTHPDYPALTSLVDTLDNAGFTYNAAEATTEHFDEMQYPLLAHVKNNDNSQGLSLIANKSQWQTILQQWTGVIIMPEGKIQFNNAENTSALKNQNQNQITIWIIGLLFIAIAEYSFYKTTQLQYGLFLITNIIAIGISILIFLEEVGIKSDTVKKVCGTISPQGCAAVLQSKQAKGIFGFTPAVMGLAYFLVQFVMLNFIGNNNILYQIALLGLGMVIWSIVTQKYIIKKWCALCLGIAFILLLQFAISFFNIYNIQFFDIWATTKFIIIGSIFAFAILFIKDIYTQYKKTKTKANNYIKWKKDITIFNALMANQPDVDNNFWEGELYEGNPNAPVKITMVCNPYCGPCASGHKQIEEILKTYGDKVVVHYRFNTNNKETSDIDIAVKAILQTTNENNGKNVGHWFEKMNLADYKTKNEIDKNKNVKDILLKHHNWANEVNIEYTPTYFINGKKIDNRYTIDELKLLIPQMG